MGETTRVEFSQRTRDVIAARAGYRCSFPTCRKGTIGPGFGGEETASIGVACHIFSAAPGGPRGRHDLTAEQLAAVSNGFWACQDHARLVDTNDGQRYPAGLLIGWRDLHEARIHREMGGLRLPVRWVEGLEIRKSPILSRDRGRLFIPNQRLNLSRTTLVVGSNATGKTALCDWMSASAEENNLGRWAGAELDIALTLYDPEPHVLNIRSAHDDFVFRFDGEVVPFNPLPVSIQTLKWPVYITDELSDAAWLATWLGTSTDVVRRLAETIRRSTNLLVETIDIEERGRIVVKLHVEDHSFSLRQLGGRSTLFLGLAFAMARAANTARHAPTLLVLDGVFTALDPDNKAAVLALLASQDDYQSLANILPGEAPDVAWNGWTVARIQRTPDGSIIDG